MIFFLFGDDTYRFRQKLKDIKDKFRKEVDPSGLNLTVIDGAKTDLDAISRGMQAVPFLAKRRMVVVEDIFSNKDDSLYARLLDFLIKHEDPAQTSGCIKVFWQAGAAPSSKKRDRTKSKDPVTAAKTAKSSASDLWNFLASQKLAFDFSPLTGQAIVAWVAEQFKAASLPVSREAVDFLIARVGSDAWALKNEIDKLCAYAAACGKNLTSAIVQDLVPAQFDDNIFKLVDAVGLGQKGVALRLIEDQIGNGVNENYLVSMINRCFRVLTLVKMTPPAQQSKLGLHPFVLKKAGSQAQKYAEGDLKKIYQKLLNLDEQIKTGFAQPVVLIDFLIASLA